MIADPTSVLIEWLITVFTENAQELIVTSFYLLWYIDLFEVNLS